MKELVNRKVLLVLIFGLIIVAYFFLPKRLFNFSSPSKQKLYTPLVDEAVATKFRYLSTNGNSSCSVSFKDSIQSKPDDTRLQGSCCSPMSLHRYSEQVEGLKKYSNIPEIPSDPYDIQAGLAKMLMSHYNDTLTPDEQKAYDYAMTNSDEKGPCCCKCWRWYVYGGLAKYLIKDHSFTGEQITELWNLSDGCGGDYEHHHG